ncbi:MAG: UDP-3-O-acyl-N-acetylglucosamine deacetylase [Gammaproteobacteria bacterium]|nr:UDP-3-O-acyl-N-acetylglucosamine deacetylase [Gammaproteobacteria bacterium]
MDRVNQKTVADDIYIVGKGVHSGKSCAMAIRPAGANTGIRFLRTDTNRSVKAHTSNVIDTQLSTSLSGNHSEVDVSTVEHLMYALWVTEIDNALISLNGGEVPVQDGSALSYVEAIRKTGVVSSHVPRKWLRVTQATKVTSEDAYTILKPYDGFKISYTFEHDSPVFDPFPKYLELDSLRSADFDAELTGARTFGEFKDLAMANRIGKCLGSDLTNSIGLDDAGVMNEEGLRFEDEFVRHKMLDAIGDLYLLGMPVLGEFVGYRSGHHLNSLLTKTLLDHPHHFEIVNTEFSAAAV